jgi:hypothetical protein
MLCLGFISQAYHIEGQCDGRVRDKLENARVAPIVWRQRAACPHIHREGHRGVWRRFRQLTLQHPQIKF